MNTTKPKKTGNKITFKMSGIKPQLANALRRTIIAETPAMAVEEVTFYKNSSIMEDEVLAHRIGLIPLTTDLKTYDTRQECTCDNKGCAKCTATLTLDAKGPTTVHSKDLKTTDPKIKPVYDNIPIVKLLENHEIKLEAKAILGRGADHMKWQAALATYTEEKPGHYDFTIESYGQLKPEEILSTALDTLQQKIKGPKSKAK
jgi:DNA-directed RNA polymerase subunit D